MSVYHQMGHDSQNLLEEVGLNDFRGAVLSPVNYGRSKILQQLDICKKIRADFETVFDPQLYVPNSQRGQLSTWAYFPKDVDTADMSSKKWWEGVLSELTKTCQDIKPSSVCSPAILPKLFSNEYYDLLVEIARVLKGKLASSKIQTIQTAIVGLKDVSAKNRALEISSLLSKSDCERLFVIFAGEKEPRREFDDPEELKGALRLINELESSGMRVIVGYCSSDILLWKSAGATDCAAGKFFNLRRFTPSRFEDPTEAGGGQLPYWFEESLVAYLRESDLGRIEKEGLISDASRRNQFCNEIIKKIKEEPGKAWVALSWRQFLYWFADVENRIGKAKLDVGVLLKTAEKNWLLLEDKDILMEEPRNDGHWIRQWRRALNEYKKSI
ncbi:MAG: hypothetical protein HY291_00115 [Planctomycetes bacterium]|nr:hypothetical protein [Planctomycetota bacterium]